MINPDGSAKINIVETEKPAEIVFEDCKFIKTQINNKYLEMPGDRNMKFINCIFKICSPFISPFKNFIFSWYRLNN